MDMWQKWGCDIEEELKRNVFLALWGIFGIELWKCGKSGGATFRKRQRKDDFLLSGGFFEWILDIWQKWECDIQEETEKRQMIFCSLGNFWNQILDIWQKWGCDIEDETEKN